MHNGVKVVISYRHRPIDAEFHGMLLYICRVHLVSRNFPTWWYILHKHRVYGRYHRFCGPIWYLNKDDIVFLKPHSVRLYMCNFEVQHMKLCYTTTHMNIWSVHIIFVINMMLSFLTFTFYWPFFYSYYVQEHHYLCLGWYSFLGFPSKTDVLCVCWCMKWY